MKPFGESQFTLRKTEPEPVKIEQEDYGKYEQLLQHQENIEASFSNPEVKRIDNILKEPLEKKLSALEISRNIVSNNAFKAAFISLMLFAKAGPAMAEKLSDAKPAEHSINYEQAPSSELGEHNYIADYEEFATIKATSYFETDKADISQEDVYKIKDDFDRFLNGIDKDNIEQALSNRWVIKGSSDERETNSWEGGNESLTKARIDALENVIRRTLASHEFKGLSKEDIQKLREKEIKASYPEGKDGKESGVTYISDMNNPDTGLPYSETEISEMKAKDPDKYAKLLEDCRYTEFQVESGFFSELEEFDKTYFLIDESASMTACKNFISENLYSMSLDKPVTLMGYSDILDKGEIDCKNSKEAAAKVLNMPTDGSFRERQVDAALNLLSDLSKQEDDQKQLKKKIYIVTDEAIQHINSTTLDLLEYKAEQTNSDIELLLSYKQWKGSQYDGYQENKTIKVPISKLAERIKELKEKIGKDKAENLSEQKIDKHYESEYQEKKEIFKKFLSHYESVAFRNLLSQKGFGINIDEIADSLSERLSGPKGYAEIYELINPKKVEKDIVKRYSGQISSQEAALSTAVMHSVRSLREMIDAKNQYDLISKATANMPDDEIPNISDNILINKVDNLAPEPMPENGPRGLVANLYY